MHIFICFFVYIFTADSKPLRISRHPSSQPTSDPSPSYLHVDQNPSHLQVDQNPPCQSRHAANPGRPLAMRDRQRILDLYEKGHKISHIARIIGVTHSCVSKIMTRYRTSF